MDEAKTADSAFETEAPAVPALALGDWAIYSSTKDGHAKLALVVGTPETTDEGTSLAIEDGTVNIKIVNATKQTAADGTVTLEVFSPNGHGYTKHNVPVRAVAEPGTVRPRN